MLKNISILLSIGSATALRGSASLRTSQVEEPSVPSSRNLAATVEGECTLDNFAKAVGGKAALAKILGVDKSDATITSELEKKCGAALKPSIDLSDTLARGPQFLKNFLDGGTTWNDNYENSYGYYSLTNDAAIIPAVYKNSATSAVFGKPNGGADDAYPRYFSNFYTGERECRSGAMSCCYSENRLPDTDFVGNSEMCALDMTPARQSNHINRAAFTFYDATSSSEAYCTGFAYEEGSFGEAVKYNTLFHMAMMTNLYEDGYVKNIPGAPLCGCVEQMPIVSNADCVKAVEGYSIDDTGNISVNIKWDECGSDLASYYATLESKSDVEKEYMHSKVVGTDEGACEAAAISFMNDKMYVPITSR